MGPNKGNLLFFSLLQISASCTEKEKGAGRRMSASAVATQHPTWPFAVVCLFYDALWQSRPGGTGCKPHKSGCERDLSVGMAKKWSLVK